MSKPLSKLQKATLAQAARRAFNYQTGKRNISNLTFDQFRHDDVERVVGKSGLRACGNEHYSPLLAHWQSLAGDEGRAFETILKGQSNGERQLRHLIARTLASAGFHPEYAESIALDRWQKPVEDLDEKQLSHLLMTLRSRAQARKRRASAPSPLRGEGLRPAGRVRGSTN